MSYSIKDAQVEFEGMIDHALQTRDIELAHQIANVYAEQGEDDQADYWHNLAKKWDNEDWSHDRAKDNQ